MFKFKLIYAFICHYRMTLTVHINIIDIISQTACRIHKFIFCAYGVYGFMHIYIYIYIYIFIHSFITSISFMTSIYIYILYIYTYEYMYIYIIERNVCVHIMNPIYA